MRKIVRSLTCPSEYSIGVNTNLHSPLPLSLSFSFFTSKEKRGDRKQRLRATLGDTFIRTGTGKGYFVCISCRPSSASYKSTKGESVSTYASIPIPRRRRGNLEMPWIFVSNCAISARFHPKGVSGGGQVKIHTQAKYRRLPRVLGTLFFRSSNYVRTYVWRGKEKRKRGAAKFSIEFENGRIKRWREFAWISI